MSVENRDELQLFTVQVIQDGGCLARVYSCSMVMITDFPELNVLEGVNRDDIGSMSHDRR